MDYILDLILQHLYIKKKNYVFIKVIISIIIYTEMESKQTTKCPVNTKSIIVNTMSIDLGDTI